MFCRKSIVLSVPNSSSNKKAVLTLEEVEEGLKGTLRLYNFSHDLEGISSLGLYFEQKVYKAGLTFKSHMLYEFFIGLKKIPSKFSCAVVNFKNAVASPILYGSSEGNDDNIYGSIITEISKDSSLKNAEEVLQKFDVNFDEHEQEEIDKEIDKACTSNMDCENCIYKKYFYENSAFVSSAQPEIKEENAEIPEKQEEVSPSFLSKIKSQIDKLFEDNPAEKNLQDLIPSSKWVKVEYEDDGDFYVFGLLYDDDDNIRYVCYGVPAIFEEEPPKELAGYPIWLPLDKNNLKGFGYWLTYQDASTGEPVKAILD